MAKRASHRRLGERPERAIVVRAIDVKLPAATAISLGFIVNELLTNAVKYGGGGITVRLEQNSEKGYALSVTNNGPVLPEMFDPFARKGLGLSIINALVEQIGGKLRYGRAMTARARDLPCCSLDRLQIGLQQETIMSLGLILVIILVIFLLGGFSGRFGGYGYGYGNGGIGVIGIILIVLVVLLLMGRI